MSEYPEPLSEKMKIEVMKNNHHERQRNETMPQTPFHNVDKKQKEHMEGSYERIESCELTPTGKGIADMQT
jgi:hypothetical protein